MYRLLYALTISSVLVCPAFAVTRTQNIYASEVAIRDEFSNFENSVQDKQFTVVTSSPSANDGKISIYSNGDFRSLFYGASYYFELKKR